MNEPSAPCQVSIRPVIESDLPELFEFQREPDANAMAAFPARDEEAFFLHWHKVLADASCVVLAVIVNGHVAGHIGSWTQEGMSMVGYWIGKRYWGRGVATAALAQFIGQNAERPLTAFVVKHNHASIRVLEKCGFIHAADEIDESKYVLR